MPNDQDRHAGESGSGAPVIPEFIRKLHGLLEDERHVRVVSWGGMGDSFIVKDQSEFSKSILPMHFKHSNFASFVRQLNKYDFHKVKRNVEDDIPLYGEHAWEFRHPMFRRRRSDLLENIRRKCAGRTRGLGAAGQSGSQGGSAPGTPGSDMLDDKQAGKTVAHYNHMRVQLDAMTRLQHEASEGLRYATRHCDQLTAELNEMRHRVAKRDKFMTQLLQYLVSRDAAGSMSMDGALGQLVQTHADLVQEDIASATAGDMVGSPSNTGTGTLPPGAIKLGIRSASSSMPGTPPMPAGGSDRSATFLQQLHASPPSMLPHTPTEVPTGTSAAATAALLEPFAASAAAVPVSAVHLPQQPSLSESASHVYALPAGLVNGPFAPASLYMPAIAMQHPSISGDPSTAVSVDNIIQLSMGNPVMTVEAESATARATKRINRVARRTKGRSSLERHMNWRQAPKVLIVEDDVICRRFSGRILQLLGCTLDEAPDGLTAVSKMNLGNYDLVLMDIMMPHMDGMRATTQIRQFNRHTPIISVTANSTPNARGVYLSCGMNDVLDKPINQERLQNVIEKYCVHLMLTCGAASSVPRPLPPAGVTEHDEHSATSDAVVSSVGSPVFPALAVDNTATMESQLFSVFMRNLQQMPEISDGSAVQPQPPQMLLANPDLPTIAATNVLLNIDLKRSYDTMHGLPVTAAIAASLAASHDPTGHALNLSKRARVTELT